MWGNEILYPADLNTEFNNIINNASSLISPLSGSLDWDGYAHTLDAAGVTTAQSTSGIAWSLTPGSKAGTPSTTGSSSNWGANTYTDTATAGSGTATVWTAHSFQRPTLAASNSSVTTTDAATVYIANSPLAGSNETLTNAWSLWVDAGNTRLDGQLTVNDLLSAQGGMKGHVALGGHLSGLTLSNGTDATNDIDIAVGTAVSSDSTATSRRLLSLTSAITKQLDAAWAVGSNAGGLDTGAIANGTYHVWLIMRSDTGVVDALFSTSTTSPTMPTNYDFKRRIGSILRESGSIVAFVQNEDRFLRKVPISDYNATNPGTSAVLRALSVPLGLNVFPIHSAVFHSEGLGGAAQLLITSPSQTDTVPSATVFTISNMTDAIVTPHGNAFVTDVQVDTSAQLRTRCSASSASSFIAGTTHGWVDTRGRG